MIEHSRRHGHFDSRFDVGGASGDLPKLSLVPTLTGPSRPGDGAKSEPRRLVLAVASSDDAERELAVWENEGGGSIVDGSPRSDHGDPSPPGLNWHEFSAGRFPRVRRHEMTALKAYESYRRGRTIHSRPKEAPMKAHAF